MIFLLLYIYHTSEKFFRSFVFHHTPSVLHILIYLNTQIHKFHTSQTQRTFASKTDAILYNDQVQDPRTVLLQTRHERSQITAWRSPHFCSMMLFNSCNKMQRKQALFGKIYQAWDSFLLAKSEQVPALINARSIRIEDPDSRGKRRVEQEKAEPAGMRTHRKPASRPRTHTSHNQWQSKTKLGYTKAQVRDTWVQIAFPDLKDEGLKQPSHGAKIRAKYPPFVDFWALSVDEENAKLITEGKELIHQHRDWSANAPIGEVSGSTCTPLMFHNFRIWLRFP